MPFYEDRKISQDFSLKKKKGQKQLGVVDYFSTKITSQINSKSLVSLLDFSHLLNFITNFNDKKIKKNVQNRKVISYPERRNQITLASSIFLTNSMPLKLIATLIFLHKSILT